MEPVVPDQEDQETKLWGQWAGESPGRVGWARKSVQGDMNATDFFFRSENKVNLFDLWTLLNQKISNTKKNIHQKLKKSNILPPN